MQLVWQDGRYQEWATVIRHALGDGRTPPVPAAGNAFSLANPADAERLLTAAGFIDVEVTDVREPVYYGSDAEAAFNAIRSLGMAQDLRADLDPAQTEHANQRLLDTLAAHHTADGVWFDSRAWIITAQRR